MKEFDIGESQGGRAVPQTSHFTAGAEAAAKAGTQERPVRPRQESAYLRTFQAVQNPPFGGHYKFRRAVAY